MSATSQLPKPPTPAVAAVHSSAPAEKKASISQLSTLAQELAEHMRGAVRGMDNVNMQTRLLSLNAQIEAARSGAAGRAFGVVATEMARLSQQTGALVNELNERSQKGIRQLTATLESLSTEIRGTRLSDLALTNIDLIDRNLYERSCDVRWWATDSAVVDALAQPGAASAQFASHRLGVILDAYTVYFDIVVCDLNGRVVANGRPAQFHSVGTNQSPAAWFVSAMATASGAEFGFQSVFRHDSIAGGQHVLVYSCVVREQGQAHGRALGVLGIVFNWESLAQTIVKGTLLSDEERADSRVCIVDDHGVVLADSNDRILQDRLELPEQAEIFAIRKGHRVVDYHNRRTVVAHALSPGFETYRTGWHSVLIQAT